MSYAEIKPQYYRMHQPDSPWHAGSPGWSTAPWPSFMPNPNLVGPPRLGVEGLGAYFKPQYEKPIAGLGMFPQKSTYRPVDGVGEYSRTGIGAYFKPEYEKAIAGLGACPCAQKGYGADDPITTNSGAMRMDVVVPVGIIAAVAGFALWVSLKK